eukprot:923105-Pyramimonas_sp.AAC.1
MGSGLVSCAGDPLEEGVCHPQLVLIHLVLHLQIAHSPAPLNPEVVLAEVVEAAVLSGKAACWG